MVYEFRPSPGDATTVILDASKIVDGKTLPMGTLTLTYQERDRTWKSEVGRADARAQWSYSARGSGLSGTLISLPARALIRSVQARRR